jgi:DNA replication protein DnaC
MLELGTCEFMEKYKNIVFQGFTGSGKTYLACAIGKQACKQQYRTRYIRIPDLLMEYDEYRLIPTGTQKLLKKYSAYHLLILDEWLLEETSNDERYFLFELIERRYGAASTIFCTQFRKEDWHGRLGGGTQADAIMDRIVHDAINIDTGTLNMREYYSSRR